MKMIYAFLLALIAFSTNAQNNRANDAKLSSTNLSRFNHSLTQWTTTIVDSTGRVVAFKYSNDTTWYVRNPQAAVRVMTALYNDLWVRYQLCHNDSVRKAYRQPKKP